MMTHSRIRAAHAQYSVLPEYPTTLTKAPVELEDAEVGSATNASLYVTLPILMIGPEPSASGGHAGPLVLVRQYLHQPMGPFQYSYPMPPQLLLPPILRPQVPGVAAAKRHSPEVEDEEEEEEEEEGDRRAEKRKNVMDVVVRKQQLEVDPWASEVKETSVRCRGCRRVIKLDGRYMYYRGLWDKHRDSCRDIKRLKGEEIPKRRKPGVLPVSAAAVVAGSDKGTPSETDNHRSISPAVTVPPLPSGSREAPALEDRRRPVLPGIHTLGLRGPGISGTSYDAYLSSRYGRHGPSSPPLAGAARHLHQSGCLLASRTSPHSSVHHPSPASAGISQVRRPPLYRCSTAYELATDFGGSSSSGASRSRDSSSRYDHDARNDSPSHRSREKPSLNRRASKLC